MSLELLQWLNTPMAAPETSSLRAMRLVILGSCSTLLLVLLFFGALLSAIGPAIAGVAAGLLLVLAVLVPIYTYSKNRADDAWLDVMTADDAGRVGE